MKKWEYVPINTNICSLTNFVKGGYWLMQDSLTGIVDSFYIANADSITSTGNLESYAYNAELNTKVIEYHNSDTVMAWLFQSQGNSTFLDLQFNPKNVNEGYELAPIVSDPFNDGSVSNYVSENNMKVKGEFLTQYNLNGHTYDNVFHYTYTNYDYPNNDQVYYNRSNGFIKIVLDNIHQHRTLIQTLAKFERRY